AIGLDVQLVPVAGNLGRTTYRTGQYAMMVFGLVPGSSIDPTYYLDQYATGVDNPGTKDPTLQAMIDKARALPLDSKERTAGFQDVNRYLTDNPIWAPICSPLYTWVGTKQVIGLGAMPNAGLSQVPDTRLLQLAKTK